MIVVFLQSSKPYFRVHCFNNWGKNGQCPDLEISYLIECQMLPETSAVDKRGKIQQRSLTCAVENEVTTDSTADLTYTTTTSAVKNSLVTIYFVTFIITIVV